MKHSQNVERYSGTLDELVEDIGNLRYDVLQEVLYGLADKIQSDADKDSEAGRGQLADRLYSAANILFDVGIQIEWAWKISEPHMNKVD